MYVLLFGLLLERSSKLMKKQAKIAPLFCCRMDAEEALLPYTGRFVCPTPVPRMPWDMYMIDTRQLTADMSAKNREFLKNFFLSQFCANFWICQRAIKRRDLNGPFSQESLNHEARGQGRRLKAVSN